MNTRELYEYYTRCCIELNKIPLSESHIYKLLQCKDISEILMETRNNDWFSYDDKKYLLNFGILKWYEKRVEEKYILKKYWRIDINI